MNNGRRHTKNIKQQAVLLRKNGLTHREIADKLGIGLGTAWLWTKGLYLTSEQKNAVRERRYKTAFTKERREKLSELARKTFAPFWKKPYSKDYLLNKIKQFYAAHGRIPLKREFNMYQEYKERFGSWNKAIELAGFASNPVIFSKKYRSVDNHLCDSLAEKIIDDYFYKNSVPHKRNVPYPSHPKLKADFVVEDTFIEYFGLSGEIDSYDAAISRKRKICSERNIRLIEIYPNDLFEPNRIEKILKF